MARCDLCNKVCPAHELAQLRETYQVDGIVDVCISCRKWADAIKGVFLGEISMRMRDAIRVRAGLPQPKSVLQRIIYALKGPTP